MFSSRKNKKLPADPAPEALGKPRPDVSARRDPALAAIDFRDRLIGLIDQAQANVSHHVLVDLIEAQLTRLRTHYAATRPW
jgi:hypothetical protein